MIGDGYCGTVYPGWWHGPRPGGVSALNPAASLVATVAPAGGVGAPGGLGGFVGQGLAK